MGIDDVGGAGVGALIQIHGAGDRTAGVVEGAAVDIEYSAGIDDEPVGLLGECVADCKVGGAAGLAFVQIIVGNIADEIGGLAAIVDGIIIDDVALNLAAAAWAGAVDVDGAAVGDCAANAESGEITSVLSFEIDGAVIGDGVGDGKFGVAVCAVAKEYRRRRTERKALDRQWRFAGQPRPRRCSPRRHLRCREYRRGTKATSSPSNPKLPYPSCNWSREPSQKELNVAAG